MILDIYATFIILTTSTPSVSDNTWHNIAAIVVTVLGGSGGLVVIIKAILDYKLKAQTQMDAGDERLLARLENQIDARDQRVTALEQELDKQRKHNIMLAGLLTANGIQVPEQ